MHQTIRFQPGIAMVPPLAIELPAAGKKSDRV